MKKSKRNVKKKIFLKKNKQKNHVGGLFSVEPDKPLSEQPYIDYASNKIISDNKCQQILNASANGKVGGSRKKKNK